MWVKGKDGNVAVVGGPLGKGQQMALGCMATMFLVYQLTISIYLKAIISAYSYETVITSITRTA
jgi:hypothetical protein